MATSKTKPIPEGYHSVTPTLTLKDSRKAVDFYVKAFGAQSLGIMPNPDGKGTMHAVIKIGDSMIMMGDEMPQGGCKSAETLGSSPISLYIYVPNVDAVFKQAISAGATSVMPVEEMFWGDRCGTVKDPFGYQWMIATHTKDLSDDDIKVGAKEFVEKMKKQKPAKQFA